MQVNMNKLSRNRNGFGLLYVLKQAVKRADKKTSEDESCENCNGIYEFHSSHDECAPFYYFITLYAIYSKGNMQKTWYN